MSHINKLFRLNGIKLLIQRQTVYLSFQNVGDKRNGVKSDFRLQFARSLLELNFNVVWSLFPIPVAPQKYNTFKKVNKAAKVFATCLSNGQ